MPTRRRKNIKNDRPRGTSLRDASRRALEAIRAQKKDERRMDRILRDIEPDVPVGEPTICVKPTHEVKLKLHQRKLRHLHGTSQMSHPTYTRCPKMWGPSCLRCHNKHCEGRGRGLIHGSHISWRVGLRSRTRQCGIISTCVSCNMTSGTFKACRGSSVFVLARVLSRYPSRPFDAREDTVLEDAIFDA
jgi:hypothetical protein